MTISISGLLTSSKTSAVMGVAPVSHFGLVSRAAIWATTMPRPARRAISSALRLSTLKVPPPTVPSPQMPTFTGFTLFTPSATRNGRGKPRPHKRVALYEAAEFRSIEPNARSPGLQGCLGQLRGRLVTRDQLAVSHHDGRRTVDTNQLPQLVLPGHRIVAAGRRQITPRLGPVHRLLAILGTPHADQCVVAMAAGALARKGHIAHLDPAAVELRDLAMQFPAIAAVRISEHGDMRFGRLLGREHHHLAEGNGIDFPGHTLALGLAGQVDRIAILELVQIALHQELAITTGIEQTATFQMYLIQIAHRAFGNGLDGHVGL